MRRALAAAALALSLASPGAALAADAAQHRALGYSADGRYFAFEQYGIQDGSGFPYWDIFVLDLEADSWAKGTPVRVVLEAEEDTISSAMKQARAKADPILAQLKIGEPADVLIANPVTEKVTDRETVAFGVFAAMPDAYEISVRSLDLPVPKDCSDPDFVPKGMELTLKVTRPGTSLTLARDTAIPASRGCPLRYDIEAVYTRSGYEESKDVAIIGVYTRGFEGEDRRFIAVPFSLPNWE